MTDSNIPVRGTNKSVETLRVATDAGDVERQVCALGDPVDPDEIVRVSDGAMHVHELGMLAARGLVPDIAVARKFGRNPSIPTTETVISNGLTSAAPYMPATAQSIEVVSTSANDAAAGTGARSVTITGLDADFNEISQTVTLNGTSPVAVPIAMLRVYRTFVANCGTYGGTNAGTITVRVAGAGTAFVVLAVGAGQTQACHYTVPAGHTLFLRDVHMAVESTSSCDVKLKQRQNADVVAAPFAPARVAMEWDGVVGQIDYDYDCHFQFPEKTDIWMTAVKNSNGTAKVSSEFTYYLVAN